MNFYQVVPTENVMSITFICVFVNVCKFVPPDNWTAQLPIKEMLNLYLSYQSVTSIILNASYFFYFSNRYPEGAVI